MVSHNYEVVSGNEKAPDPGCFPRSGAFPSVRGGGLEPPPTIRGLAPQASASAYSATRAGDLFPGLSPRATDKTLARGMRSGQNENALFRGELRRLSVTVSPRDNLPSTEGGPDKGLRYR